MALYRYKALNARGEMLVGQMDAGSDAEVALRLQEQGHLPVEARLASEGGLDPAWRTLFKPKPFAGQRLVQFTQQLATLLGERLRLEQRAPCRIQAALARQPRLDREVALFLQAQRDLGVAARLHLPVQHFAAGVQCLVAVQGHRAVRRPR